MIVKTFSIPLVSSKAQVVQRWFSTSSKKKLVILGTGWAGFRLIKDIDVDEYDVTVVSPRNHFLFTPLLTSTTVGTLEFRFENLFGDLT